MTKIGVLIPTRESVMYHGTGDPRPLVAMYVTVAIGNDDTAQASINEHSELYYNKPAAEIHSWQAGCAGPADKVVEFIRDFIDAGAEHVCVRFATRDVGEQIELLAGHLDELR